VKRGDDNGNRDQRRAEQFVAQFLGGAQKLRRGQRRDGDGERDVRDGRGNAVRLQDIRDPGQQPQSAQCGEPHSRDAIDQITGRDREREAEQHLVAMAGGRGQAGEPRPMDLLRLGGKARRRASGERGRPEADKPWSWDDDA